MRSPLLTLAFLLFITISCLSAARSPARSPRRRPPPARKPRTTTTPEPIDMRRVCPADTFVVRDSKCKEDKDCDEKNHQFCSGMPANLCCQAAFWGRMDLEEEDAEAPKAANETQVEETQRRRRYRQFA